jgi:hypothetical protein
VIFYSPGIGICADLGGDVSNCGACFHGCGPAPANGEIACENGACVSRCLDGYVNCSSKRTGNVCVYTANDPANSGGCGTACPSGQACANGACGCSRDCPPDRPLDPDTCSCACPAGSSPCGDACVDLTAEPANCGVCGRHCGAKFPICDGGQCMHRARPILSVDRSARPFVGGRPAAAEKKFRRWGQPASSKSANYPTHRGRP